MPSQNYGVSLEWLCIKSVTAPSDCAITNIVHQHQVQLYWHVADPASQVVSKRDSQGWRRPRGRSQSLWLKQVNASCWELLGMGMELAWRLAMSDRRGWRCKMGKTTHPLAYAPNELMNVPESLKGLRTFKLCPEAHQSSFYQSCVFSWGECGDPIFAILWWGECSILQFCLFSHLLVHISC